MPTSSTLSLGFGATSCSMRASTFGDIIAFACADRDLEVGERELAIGLRHELFAPHDVEQIQHLLVEHFPGPDLLLDHVEPGLLDIHKILEKLPLSNDLNTEFECR